MSIVYDYREPKNKPENQARFDAKISFSPILGNILVEQPGAFIESISTGMVWLTMEQAYQAASFGWKINNEYKTCYKDTFGLVIVERSSKWSHLHEANEMSG
jgi:hypothetical protein